MANEQHLTLLRSGVREWNDWVQTKTTLTASRPRADLVDVDLSGIVLKGANLIGANLQGANLSGADLSRADLIGARLMGANLSQTVLFDANLRGAKLMGANLKGANLTMANLSSADLTSADLERAMLLDTLFANCSLHDTQGLDRCDHRGRSTVDQRTLEISGRMPDAFLRGCGLSDWQIEAAKLNDPKLTPTEIYEITNELSHIRAVQPTQTADLFISHSHADHKAIDTIQGLLVKAGIRNWRYNHDAESGPLEEIVHSAISSRVVLLVLSKNSVTSDWVEHEARLARKIAKEQGRHVLCPIALDDSWKTCKWPNRLREQIMEYTVLDFARMDDQEFLNNQFRLLVKGLHIHYGGAKSA